jgi:hypothetical protein
MALAEQEVTQRERNRQLRTVKAARFPLLKELADFDFSCVPSLNKQQVLQLAQGEYIRQTEPVLFVGNPGLGKTHVATGLALAACRQGYRVRFYNAATLVNELLQAQVVPFSMINWYLFRLTKTVPCTLHTPSPAPVIVNLPLTLRNPDLTPTATPTVQPGSCLCDRDRYNCGDFGAQAAAQMSQLSIIKTSTCRSIRKLWHLAHHSTRRDAKRAWRLRQ